MQCPQCQHDSGDGAKFCRKCGGKLALTCDSCGAENPPESSFCGECGEPVEAATSADVATLEHEFAAYEDGLGSAFKNQLRTHGEGENRIITVLFADMSNSVAAMRDLHTEDAASLLRELIHEMVDVLVGYEGTIDNVMGDGVLAVFGLPVAHENDPERAIRAAMDMRVAVRALGLDISAGINTGPVFSGDVGSHHHENSTIVGDVVNLAARLKDHAEAGEILVEEATHRHTHGAFEFTPRTLDVEGYDEPIQAYRAERLLPRPVRVRGIKGLAADLIGRDDELRQLKLALAKTAAGEGQIASIIGEAGVGKSRLAKELRTHATSEDSTSRVLWMEGHCVEIGVSAGYWPFIDMLTHHFGWTSEDDNATRADIVRGALSELVSLDLLTPQRRVDIGACLGRLLSVRFGDEWDERLKSVRPEQIQRQTFTAIRDFVIAVARRQPVVLVLDDLHWADNHSLDLISVMMEALTLAPVMLLCLYRSERDHASSQLATWASRTCPDQYTELALRELTTQESHRLVDSMLDIQDLPQATRDSIVDKCQGNPFFVEEVVRSLVHSGEVYEEDGVWKVLDTAETVGVPDSVHGMILSRVDTLEQGLKDVVHTACVIGRLFRRSVLEHIMQTEADIEGALAQLEDHGIIYRHRVIPEPQYSFRHTLTQEAVYETLLRSHKESVHRRAAEALEVLYQDDLEQYMEELAHHYERSDHDAKAVEYLLGAGHKARSACLNDEVIAYYERCLDTLTEAGLDDDHPDWRVSALGGLTRILVGVGRAGDAEKYGRDAVALAKATGTSRAETVRLLFWLAEALQSQSRYDDVMGIAEEGLALLADDTESVGAVLMNHQMAAAARNRGLLDLSLKHTTRNAQFIRDLPYTEELGAAYIQVAVGCMLADRDDEAARWLKTARELAEKHHDQHLVGDIALQTGAAVGGRGDLRAAVRYFSEAADISAKTGDATLGAWSVGGLAWVHLSLGELDHAERHIAEAASIAEKMGHRRDLAIALDILGTAMLGQGRAAEAVQTFHRAASLHEEIGSPQEAAALLSLGRAEMAAGEVDAAEEHLRRAALGGGGETVVVAAIAGLAELISEQDIAELAEKVHAHDESVRSVRLVARPAEATPFSSLVVSSDLSEVANDPAWTWHDLYDDCAYRVGGGCVISAANGRALGSSDLWIVRWQNVSAPRSCGERRAILPWRHGSGRQTTLRRRLVVSSCGRIATRTSVWMWAPTARAQ